MRARATLLALAALAAAAPVSGERQTWSVGSGGLAWADSVRTSSAVEFLDGGGIRLLSFTESDNIVQRLRWTADGTPRDYLTPLPNGRVWDNNPLRDREATLSVVDGDSTTSTGERFKQPGAVYERTSLFFDLGTRFPVSRISFFPRQAGADTEGRPFVDDFVRSFEVLVQDGERFTDNDLPIYSTPPLRVVESTTSSIADIPFPLQFVRYIRLRVTSNTPFEVAEFQVFGRGFSPRGELLSKVIDLGSEANFDRIAWSAYGLRQDDEGGLVRVEGARAGATVRLRTGSTPDPQIYYRIVDQGTGERIQVTGAEYRSLDPHQQGEPEDDQSRWSLWSAPLTEPDARIDLPSPRRYFQFQVMLDSGEILDGVGLDGLSVSYATPPLAREVLAEISLDGDPAPPGGQPVAPTGELSTFVYDVKADVRRGDVGFDALAIDTPARPGFVRLERGGPSWTDLAPAAADSVALTDSSLVVFFQPVTSLQYLRVVFRAPVFRQATSFDAEVRNTGGGEPAQKVLPGDAHPGVRTLESSALRVLTSAASARTLIRSLTVTPRVVTPNGDRVNEAASVDYTLTQLLEPVPVTIAVFDLAGRQVAGWKGDRGNGAHSWPWNGRGGDGRPLPPGNYIVRVSVRADSEDTERLALVAVAF